MIEIEVPYLSHIEIMERKYVHKYVIMNKNKCFLSHEPFFNVEYMKVFKKEDFLEMMEKVTLLNLYVNHRNGDLLKKRTNSLDELINLENDVKYYCKEFCEKNKNFHPSAFYIHLKEYYENICFYFVKNMSTNARFLTDKELTKKNIIKDDPKEFWTTVEEKMKFIFEKDGWIHFPKYFFRPSFYTGKTNVLDVNFLVDEKLIGIGGINEKNIDIFRINHFISKCYEMVKFCSFHKNSENKIFSDIVLFFEKNFSDNHYYNYFDSFSEKPNSIELLKNILNTKGIENILSGKYLGNHTKEQFDCMRNFLKTYNTNRGLLCKN